MLLLQPQYLELQKFKISCFTQIFLTMNTVNIFPLSIKSMSLYVLPLFKIWMRRIQDCRKKMCLGRHFSSHEIMIISSCLLWVPHPSHHHLCLHNRSPMGPSGSYVLYPRVPLSYISHKGPVATEVQRKCHQVTMRALLQDPSIPEC